MLKHFHKILIVLIFLYICQKVNDKVIGKVIEKVIGKVDVKVCVKVDVKVGVNVCVRVGVRHQLLWVGMDCVEFNMNCIRKTRLNRNIS